jgi:hypothetical protein
MKNILIGTLIILLFNHQNIHSINVADVDSATHKNYFAYSTTGHSGYLLPTWSFVRGKFKTEGPDFCQFNDLSFQVLKQTIGELPIEQIFHYPRYGFGVYTGEFFKGNYFSRPWGAYGIFIGSFADWKRLSLNYSLLLGVTGNWNHYDPANNNYNTTLADDFTTHVDFGLRLNYEITHHFEAGLGISFAHFSNGAMEIPNFGINMLAPQVSITYLPHYTKDKYIKRVLPAYLKNTYLDLALYGGEKNLPYPECDLDTAHNFFGFHYPQYGLTAVLNRNISYVVALGIGLHIGYDSSKNTRYKMVNGQMAPDLSFLPDNINLGIIPSCEFNFDRVTFVLQPCYSIYKHETSFKKPDFFGKFGLKFKLLEEYYAGIQLHTFKLHADFIEFSIGYRLPLTRQSN